MNRIREIRRLEEWIRLEARRRGHCGDPLGPDPPMQTLEEELRASDIYLDIPRTLKDIDRDLADKMCRAAVMGKSSLSDDNYVIVPGDTDLPKGSEHPAIVRANRQVMNRRHRQRRRQL